MKEPTVIRRFVGPNEDWVPISKKEVIGDLEGAGYWAEGTTWDMLLDGHQLWTPHAQYKIKVEGLGAIDGPKDIDTEFRLEIKRNLDKCNKSATPKVCEKIQSQNGYTWVEATIAKIMINDQVSAGTAIVAIETDYL